MRVGGKTPEPTVAIGGHSGRYIALWPWAVARSCVMQNGIARLILSAPSDELLVPSFQAQFPAHSKDRAGPSRSRAMVDNHRLHHRHPLSFPSARKLE